MHKFITKTLLLLLFVIGICSISIAQKLPGQVSGFVISDSARARLQGVTVTILNANDSSVEKMGVTDNKGKFIIHDLKLSSYFIVFSEINHYSAFRSISFTEAKKEIHLDTIMLSSKGNMMDTVAIVLMKPPVVLKQDTVEFNASSFKIKENDMVEDLLKKLPTLEVSKDGSITAQGEKVTQVLVDGKPFFGTDPKTATQNLPANIIDKVQVIDQKSEQSKVTKVDDGKTEKVLNITIKKDKKKGTFGRAYASYGSNDRYEGKLSANYFNNTRKVALVTSSNNTGRNDNSTGENEEVAYYNNNNGINKTTSSRITFTDEWGKKLNVNANFGYNYSSNITSQLRNRQTILQDSSNFYFEQNESRRKRYGFGGGFGFSWNPDTMTSVYLNQSVNFYTNQYSSNSVFNSMLSTKRKLNEGDRESSSTSKSPSFNGSVSFNRRFKKERRGIFFNFNNNINNNFTDNFNLSSNSFYPLNTSGYDLLLNQFTNQDNRSSSINSSVGYNEPLGKKSSLRLSVSYNYSKNNTLREIFDFNNLSQFYDLLNDSLSSDFDNLTNTVSVGLNYSYNLKKGSLSFGASWQNNQTKSISLTTDSVYRQSFSGVVPSVSYNFNNKGKRININYNFSARPPQAYQLQTIIDKSNPLYLRLGNPNLKYSVSHNLSTGFNWTNTKKGWSLNTNANVNYVFNSIANSTSYDKLTGVQTSMPVNVDGVYYTFGRLYFSQPVKFFGKKERWFLNTNMNFGRNVNLLDGRENISHNNNYYFNTGAGFSIKEIADLTVAYTLSMQRVNYSLKPEQNNTNYRHGIDVGLKITPNKTTEVNINWDFYKNTAILSSLNREVNMVDLDLTQFMNKRKTWWLKFKVYDLLKQNVNVYRFSGENFIEDVQTNSIGRFFLLSLNYKLNKFGGKNTAKK